MAPAIEQIQPGVRVLDKRRGRERVIHDVQRLGRIVRLWLKDPRTGAIDQVVAIEADLTLLNPAFDLVRYPDPVSGRAPVDEVTPQTAADHVAAAARVMTWANAQLTSSQP